VRRAKDIEMWKVKERNTGERREIDRSTKAMKERKKKSERLEIIPH
jgi:hypothetical protein